MSPSSLRALARAAGCVVLACLFLRAEPTPAQEFGPDHPQVRALVDGAVAFLESNFPNVTDDAEKALAGYAVLKSQICYREGIDPDHPVVREALSAVVATGAADVRLHTYALCVKLLFLSALDDEEQRPLVEALLAELLARQKPHGGWGYASTSSGDTSMTQFAVLTLWELERHGVATPDDAWERAIGWFLRTQDPGGGFGYQGREGEIGRLLAQTEIRESLVAGAAGSLYIALDHLGGGSRPDEAPPADEPQGDPPSEVREVDPQPPPRGPVDIDVDRAALDLAIERADAWLENTGKFPPQRYFYYYLYALERYHSFRDKAEGRAARDEHLGGPWYDAGVRLLQARAGDGRRGWSGEHSASVDTSFCILFLVRSSQLSIDGERLLGGGELNSGGKLISLVPPDAREAELLRILRDPVAGPVEAVQAAQDDSPLVRAAALDAFARTRDLDHVPLLIRALSDPHAEVAQAAHAGLRFVSRRLATVPDELPAAGAERDRVVRDWKEWYLTIRPEAQLE